MHGVIAANTNADPFVIQIKSSPSFEVDLQR